MTGCGKLLRCAHHTVQPLHGAPPRAGRRCLGRAMLWLAASTAALRPPSARPLRHQRSAARCEGPRCCICINCKWVDRCQVYHWVEDMHEQPHVTDRPGANITEPDFDPNEPEVQVFIRTMEEAEQHAAETNRKDGNELTMEYDVFGCDAFVEDQGKWLRLMPDADFIPT